MERLLLKAEEFAKRLGISRSLFYRLNAAGKIGPLPIRNLGPPLWRAKEIESWVNGGCLGREKWQEVRAAEEIKS